MFYVYILENPKKRSYIGQTNNIENRLMRHNNNRVRSTCGRGPWKLVYQKSFLTRAEAMKYEHYLKSLKNKNYLKSIIGA